MVSPSSSRFMDLTSSLINSISRFVHLVTCRVSKTMPSEDDYRNIASLLKHLKLVLDNVIDCKVPSDEVIHEESEELDIAINEARDCLEKWSPKKSKILFVLQSKPLIQRIQICSLKISRTLCRLLESSPITSSPRYPEHDVQEFENLKLEKASQILDEALGSLKEGQTICPDHLMAIVESLKLTRSQELLTECIALEKERLMVEQKKLRGNLDELDLMIDLMSHIREYMVKLDSFKAINGIKIPPYFRCPLSLELMLEPVIVASGQTYERISIQKWLDSGLSICPKTRQKLSHANLIPNYTVKALIENWCVENEVILSSIPESSDIFLVPSQAKDILLVENLQHSSHRKHSTPGISQGFDQNIVNGTSGFSEEDFKARSISEAGSVSGAERFDHSSREHSCIHSRTESTSSAVSSVDYLPTASTDASRISSKLDTVSDMSGDLTPDCPTFSPLNKVSSYSPSLSVRQYHSSKTMAEVSVNGHRNPSRSFSFSADSESSGLTTTSNVEKLVKDLKSQSNDLQTAAAAELRFLAKHNMENRVMIGQSGAVTPLISLLHSNVELTQEHAVTALLNLSINENIKAMIADEGALEPLIHVLRTGNTGAKENAAAALFSLSMLEEYRIKIGRSSAVKSLVDLLRSGTVRGKKDAATALFNLSIFHENKARIVQAGAVKYLVALLDPSTEMVDKAVALLANLSTIPEGCSAIAREEGIPSLVEIVESGSQRGKENAASILLQLSLSSPKYCRLILQEGAVPPLVALSQSGTARAKEKAHQLLGHFRNQREGAKGRVKSIK